MDKTARIWDARKATQLAVLTGHGDSVASVAYSPDGTRIVTASHDKTARIWDASTGAELTVLSGHAGFVTSGAYSPDGKRIVTASDDKTARIWDARTGAQLAVLSGHAGWLNWTAYSPDGTRIVTASEDRTARIWDARTGAQLAVLAGHGDLVDSAAYSPDGTHIVTASDDKTARIWDARMGIQLAVISGHGAAVLSAVYSPDGTRIVTASGDKTARIWDAHIPATIAAQILWEKVAETDPLSDVDRNELGLPPDARVRQWATEGSACDQAAAAFYDPDRQTRGLAQAAIVADVANSACSRRLAPSAITPRMTYQSARALLANSDVNGARQQLELAVSAGYRAAQIDLANLLVDASARILDPARAVALDQKAWQDGVPIAGYSLGKLYETAATGSQPNLAKAWEWYQRGADAGEPHALARVAERTERQALAETDPQKITALLLRAFRDYAAAAERAHDEDWPDDVWRTWRHRRATLARILASQGMMQQVADSYAEILSRPRM
jgi:TPR repeat protein